MNRNTLLADLAKYTAWSDANPLKAPLIELTRRDLGDIERAEQKAARAAAAATAAAARAKLPWWKRILA